MKAGGSRIEIDEQDRPRDGVIRTDLGDRQNSIVQENPDVLEYWRTTTS